MNVLRYVLEGKPVPWQRARARCGQRFTDKRMREAKEAHQWKALQIRPRSWSQDGVFALDLAVYVHPSSRGDVDNLAKLPMDALQGIAYRNDRQVAKVSVERHVDRDRPRTEVTLWRLS